MLVDNGDLFHPALVPLYIGPDLGFCIIDLDGDDQEHPEPPKVPIMVPNGCEADYIRHELFGDGWSPVFSTYNGMGTDDIGVKRYADGKILYQSYSGASATQKIYALQPEPDDNTGIEGVKLGDSGGPSIFAMFDGSRRIIGTISAGTRLNVQLPSDEMQTFYKAVDLTPTPLYLHWLESASGRELSPCHTWNGTTKSWDFTGGGSCGAGYEASPLSGPSADWDDSGSGINACAATDMLTTESACAGWTRPWSTGAPSWVTAHPAKSNAQGVLQWALYGTRFETLFEATGLEEVFGSSSDDRITGTAVADEIFAGAGDDTIDDAGDGNDEIHAGSGNDLVFGGNGADIIHASFGLDEVYGDNGDDVVIILGECELEEYEVYDGGAGSDTLISPLTVLQLGALGISATSFETVIITHANAQASACQKPEDFAEIAVLSGT